MCIKNLIYIIGSLRVISVIQVERLKLEFELAGLFEAGLIT